MSAPARRKFEPIDEGWAESRSPLLEHQSAGAGAGQLSACCGGASPRRRGPTVRVLWRSESACCGGASPRRRGPTVRVLWRSESACCGGASPRRRGPTVRVLWRSESACWLGAIPRRRGPTVRVLWRSESACWLGAIPRVVAVRAAGANCPRVVGARARAGAEKNRWMKVGPSDGARGLRRRGSQRARRRASPRHRSAGAR